MSYAFKAEVERGQLLTPGWIRGFFGSYRFLSNFDSCWVRFEDWFYPSVEHAYQAAKTADLDVREHIRFSPTAGEAKRRGRLAPLRTGWNDLRLSVMHSLLRYKFHCEPQRTGLRNTGSLMLEETNWWGDTFWGVCADKGENQLGRLLMGVRQELNLESTNKEQKPQ